MAVQQLIQHPRKMFLIDGIGAILSALGLLFLLIPFQSFFGMPEAVCRYLSFIAFAFTAYSLMCYFSELKNWRAKLKIIAVANSLYCLLTFGLVIKYAPILSAWGIAYFIGEVFIILCIITLEITVIKKAQMITIKSLKEIDIDQLFLSWEDAFSDYVSTVNKEELKRMLLRRGYSAELSFGAFDDDRLVSFTLNGVGEYNGQMTAYDTGTGTIKDYRGQGLVKQVFLASLPYLKEAGMRQYLLEVLQDNAPAISIYTGVGFQTTREFCYFIKPAKELSIHSRQLPDGYEIRNIDVLYEESMLAMWDVQPSWQNSFNAVKNSPEDFVMLGVYKDNSLIGYGIVEPKSGDVTQIAVHPEHRRQGLASCILHELAKSNKADIIKVINIEDSCTSITSFLVHHGINLSGKQYEMIRPID